MYNQIGKINDSLVMKDFFQLTMLLFNSYQVCLFLMVRRYQLKFLYLRLYGIQVDFNNLKLIIYNNNISIRDCGFFQMNNQHYPTSQSLANDCLSNLHIIFNQKQIVQHYPHKDHLLMGNSYHQHNYSHSQILIEHGEIEHYTRKGKIFVEDDIFGELHSAHIVENYHMLDQKDEVYQHYQNFFKGRGEKPEYSNKNMFASSSQNNDAPSRNSSLSSLSDKNQIMNMGLNASFDRRDTMQLPSKKKTHKKSFTLNLTQKKTQKINSQNEMDIQNQPSRVGPYLPRAKFTQQQQFCIPYMINPEKPQFPTYKRLDIDSQHQRKQRLQKIQKLQQIGCNCKKSKCLKMYCECFNLQIFCNQNCNCAGCCNQQSNCQHRKAVLDALTRNPKAFHQANQKIDAAFNLGIQLNEVKKGCKCKKTKCQKKYCQCFNSGQACGKFCKCDGCENC